MSVETLSDQDGWQHSIETDFENLKQALQVVDPLCEQVSTLTERVEALEATADEDDLQEAVADLRAEVDELEQQVPALLDGLDDAVERLDAVKETQDDLDERVAAIEAMFSDTLLDKEHAHNKAQERPTEGVVDEGDEYTLVVEETLYDQPDPHVRGCIDGLHVFVEVESRDYEKGDQVDIVITDLQENNANGVEL